MILMATHWPLVRRSLHNNCLIFSFWLVWNYAIHGTCWGPSQLLSNGDIMGGVNNVLETMISGVAMFINADAGDISPGEQPVVHHNNVSSLSER